MDDLYNTSCAALNDKEAGEMMRIGDVPRRGFEDIWSVKSEKWNERLSAPIQM